MNRPEVIIDGHWLSAVMPWGDLEWSTCWPGGTESITFSAARSHWLFRTDAIVELDYAGQRLACGSLVQPSRGEPLMAEGLHRKGEDYPALDATNDTADTVHEAVDQAIARGLPWTRGPHGSEPYDLSPVPLVSGAPALDLSQPHSVAKYLDASAQRRGLGWGVRADRLIIMTGWEPVSIHLLPGVDGLTISRDGYACSLYARYLDSTSGIFQTVFAHDLDAHSRWGHVERTITQPIGEGVPMTNAVAQEHVNGLLAQGRAQIGWASPLEVQYGDVVNDLGQRVDVNRLSARQSIRLHGLDLDVSDLSGRTWFDMPIARTRHKDGVVTIEPLGLSTPMSDVLAGAGR